MIDNEQKKPIKKNPTWFRCVIVGEVVVFGSLIVPVILRELISAIFGDFVFFHYFGGVSYFFIPLMIPVFVWQKFQEAYYPGNAEALMLYIIPMFASLVIWWIFLGVVLGTVIYRVRLYMRRKDEREK